MTDGILRVTAPTGDYTVPVASACRIGRNESNDVVIADDRASRFHAAIQRDAAGRYHLIDASSRNGTLLNDRLVVAPTLLADGDQIQIGSQLMRFELAGVGTLAVPEAPTRFMMHQGLVSVLVIDMRGFTVLSRAIGEQATGTLVSEFFQVAGNLLGQHSVWSQKYIGDAVMGVWQHPEGQVPLAQLGGILAIGPRLAELVAAIGERMALPAPLRLGAGLNVGLAATGNMGGMGSADFTALGDAVNKAFRLEAASKAMDCDMLVACAAFDLAMPRPLTAGAPPPVSVELKGFDAPESAFALSFSDTARLAAALQLQASAARTAVPVRT